MSDETHHRRVDDQWPMWTYRAMVGMLVGVFVIGLTLMARNTVEIYRLSRELVIEQTHLQVVTDRQNALRTEVSQRLDDIEKTLFGELVSKLDRKANPPLRPAEAWQVNRDRELRAMIRGLQDFRLKIEAQVRELERRQ